MGAPTGNQNRTGKTGQRYNVAVPKLTCGTCVAREGCPLVSANPNAPCAFIRRIKKFKLDSRDDIREIRKQLILESLAQLTVHSMITEKKGITDKETIAFRKLLLEQLAQLERDQFTQEMKQVGEEKNTILGSLIQQVKSESRFTKLEIGDG